MVEDLDISKLVESAGNSSRHSRWVVLVITTASILSFVAFMNSRQNSWINLRLELAKLAVGNCVFPKEEEVAKQCQEIRCWDANGRLERAEKYLQIYKIDSRVELRESIANWRLIKQNQVLLLQVPLLGFSLDVNDLGLFSSTAFVVLLLLLRFWLTRELLNIRLVFAEARRSNKLRYCYLLMSMKQVLTVPPLVEQAGVALWKPLLKILVFLPLFIQAIVYGHDLFSADIAYMFNVFNAALSLSFQTVALVVIVFLTWICIKLVRLIDVEWDACAAELGEQMQKEAAAA